MGRKSLQEEDRLVEMVESAVGVGGLAEQSDAGLRDVLRGIAAKLGQSRRPFL